MNAYPEHRANSNDETLALLSDVAAGLTNWQASVARLSRLPDDHHDKLVGAAALREIAELVQTSSTGFGISVSVGCDADSAKRQIGEAFWTIEAAIESGLLDGLPASAYLTLLDGLRIYADILARKETEAREV